VQREPAGARRFTAHVARRFDQQISSRCRQLRPRLLGRGPHRHLRGFPAGRPRSFRRSHPHPLGNQRHVSPFSLRPARPPARLAHRPQGYQPRPDRETVRVRFPLAARHGENHELLKRIGRFQREIPSVNLDLSQNLSAVIGGAALVPDNNSLHSLQPPWIRTFEANQTGAPHASDAISSNLPATETRRDHFSSRTRRPPTVKQIIRFQRYLKAKGSLTRPVLTPCSFFTIFHLLIREPPPRPFCDRFPQPLGP